MAEENAPAAAKSPAAPVDFQAAALKALEEGPPKEQTAPTPAEGEKPKDVKAEVADAEKKLADEMTAKKAEEGKPPEKPEEKAPKGWEKPFEKLAMERAELRAQQKAIKEQQALLEEAKALKAAKESGDPLKLLEANGWAWDDVVAHLTGGPKGERKGAPPAPKVNDEIAQLRAEVQAMKAEKAQATVMDTISKVMSTSEFKYVKELASPREVYAELDAFVAANGELPIPNDLNASIALVLEAAEGKLKEAGERFKKVFGLTQPASPGSVAGAAKGDVRSAGESVVSGTLSNSLDGAPRATTPPSAKPTTPEEYRAAALKALVEGPKR